MAKLTPYQEALLKSQQAPLKARDVERQKQKAKEVFSQKQQQAQSKLDQEEYDRTRFNDKNIKAYDEAISAARLEYPAEPNKWEDYALSYLKENAKDLGTPYFSSLEQLPEEVRSVVKMEYPERKKALADISAQQSIQEKRDAAQRKAPGLAYREAPVAAQKVSIIPESVKKGLNTFSEAYANLDPVYRDVKTSIGVDQVNARKMAQEAGKIAEATTAITPKIEEAGAKTAATAAGIQDMKAEVQALLAKQAAMKASNAETMAKEDAIHQANLAQQAKWADERNVEAFREQQAAPDAYRFQAIHPWHGKGWVSYVGGLPKVGPTKEAEAPLLAQETKSLIDRVDKTSKEMKDFNSYYR